MLARTTYWLGGSPCAGKSSITQEIATRYGWDVYLCDTAYQRHSDDADPHTSPTLYKIGRLRGDALWLRPVPEQTATEIAMYHEESAAILADIAALPGVRPLLVEGAALLPEIIAPLVSDGHHAAWLVPTPAFQRQHYAQRDWSHAVVANCGDPGLAFDNWMARDIAFAAHVSQTARANHLPLRIVDGSEPVAASVAWLLAQWQLT